MSPARGPPGPRQRNLLWAYLLSCLSAALPRKPCSGALLKSDYRPERQHSVKVPVAERAGQRSRSAWGKPRLRLGGSSRTYVAPQAAERLATSASALDSVTEKPPPDVGELQPGRFPVRAGALTEARHRGSVGEFSPERLRIPLRLRHSQPRPTNDVPANTVIVREGQRPAHGCVIMSGFAFRSKATEMAGGRSRFYCKSEASHP